MRQLLFTTGSPFARAVRIVLDELGLEWRRQEELTTPTVAQRAAATPTLQVPTFWDGDLVLWESGLIVEYLLETYPDRPEAQPPLAGVLARDWRDKLTLATIQTLGASATLIGQMRWDGVTSVESTHLARSAARIAHLLRWLEARLPDDGGGFIPGVLSAQDIFLGCHLGYIANRPLDVEFDPAAHPRIDALLDRLEARPSFRAHPVRWWEPGVTGYTAAGEPIYR